MIEQSKVAIETARARGLAMSAIQRDADTRFSKEFRRVLRQDRVVTHRNAMRAPMMNVFVARLIKSI